MISEGDTVRCFASASHLWTVVATDVDREVEVDAERVWRIPNGDTVIRDGNTAIVVPEGMLKLRSDEVGSS